MKKATILATALLLSFNSLLHAEEGKISFGLELSPALTWLNTSSDGIVEDGNSVKLNGGLIVNINLGETYSIITGLRYNSYGGNFDGPNVETNEIKYEFNEFEIPIGLKLRTGSFGKMRYAAHINTGMGIMIKPKETIVGLGDYENVSISDKTDYKIFPIRALYEIAIGGEYDLGAVILCGKIGYKGWFSNLYFYNDKINLPADQLQLIDPVNAGDPAAAIYPNTITFQPSAVELTIGVIF